MKTTYEKTNHVVTVFLNDAQLKQFDPTLIPNDWKYIQKEFDGGIQHSIQLRYVIDFKKLFDKLDDEQKYALSKRSYVIDGQSDLKQICLETIGCVKKTSKLNVYKTEVLEKMIKSGMTKEKALKILNS